MIKEFFDYFDSDRPLIKPNDWPFSHEFKQYHVASLIQLPHYQSLEGISLEKSLQKRTSAENFSGRPLSLSEISTLLFWSAGLIHRTDYSNTDRKNLARRPYPSGGARYPLELYIAVFRVSDIEPGVYHYNVPRHGLELLSDVSPDALAAVFSGHTELASAAPGAVFISFINQRTIPKYGTLGLKLGLLEGGHIGQNIYLVAAALGLSVLATGTIDYEAAHRELGLDPEVETLFYQFLIGWPEEK